MVWLASGVNFVPAELVDLNSLRRGIKEGLVLGIRARAYAK